MGELEEGPEGPERTGRTGKKTIVKDPQRSATIDKEGANQ
jgi:hypothetical protein